MAKKKKAPKFVWVLFDDGWIDGTYSSRSEAKEEQAHAEITDPEGVPEIVKYTRVEDK